MDPDKMESLGKKSRFEKMKERMQRQHNVELEEWRRKVEQLELKLQMENEGKDDADNISSKCKEQRSKAVALEKTVEELKVQMESTKADIKKEIDSYKTKLKEEQRKCINLERKMICTEIKLMAEESKTTFFKVDCESTQLKIREVQMKFAAAETELKDVHTVLQAKQICDLTLMEAMEETTELEKDQQQQQIALVKEATDMLQRELRDEQRRREEMALDIQDLRECLARTMAEIERESAEREARCQEKSCAHEKVKLVEQSGGDGCISGLFRGFVEKRRQRKQKEKGQFNYGVER